MFTMNPSQQKLHEIAAQTVRPYKPSLVNQEVYSAFIAKAPRPTLKT